MATTTTNLCILGLMALPFAAAILIALLGNKRPAEARWIALGASVLGLLVAILLTVTFIEHRGDHPLDGMRETTFKPVFVPGSTEQAPHKTTWNLHTFGDVAAPRGAVQFFIGLDGINVWLVLLTAFITVKTAMGRQLPS